MSSLVPGLSISIAIIFNLLPSKSQTICEVTNDPEDDKRLFSVSGSNDKYGKKLYVFSSLELKACFGVSFCTDFILYMYMYVSR